MPSERFAVPTGGCAVACSRRNSLWANAALVVTVGPADWAHLEPEHGPLAAMRLQVAAER